MELHSRQQRFVLAAYKVAAKADDRFTRIAERRDEAMKLPPHLLKVFRARAANGRQAGAMIHPKQCRRRVAVERRRADAVLG